MLEMGVIDPSKSNWFSPIVLVPKPDGSIHFCIDFRAVNKVSKFDQYPLPRIDKLIEKLGDAQYITTIDLTKGYLQVPLRLEDRKKNSVFNPLWAFSIYCPTLWTTRGPCYSLETYEHHT